MKTLTIGRGNFFGVAYSPDGRYLVSGNSERHIRFWDLSTFQERLHFAVPEGDPLRGMTFTYQTPTFLLHGPRLVMTSTVWDISRAWESLAQVAADRPPLPGEKLFTRVELEHPGQDPHITMAAGQAGNRLVGSNWSYIGPRRTHALFWGPQGHCHRRFSFVNDSHVTMALALAPDGQLLAASLRKRVLLVDLAAEKTIAELPQTDTNALRFSPDGQLLAVAAGRSVRLWDVNTHKLLARFPPFQRHVYGLAFHGTGQLLAAGSADGEVRLWDTASFEQVACLDWKVGAIHNLAFSPDGMTIAAAGHANTIVVWDLE
jgi:hypothetical protein